MKKRAQGVYEYLFMVAVALIIVLMTVHHLLGSKDSIKGTGKFMNSTEKNISKELSF